MAEGKIQSLKKQNEKIAEGKVTKIKDIAKEKIKKAEEKAEEKAKEKDSIINSLKEEAEKKDAVIEKAESKVKKIKDIAKEKIKKAEEKAEDNFFSSVSSEEDGN